MTLTHASTEAMMNVPSKYREIAELTLQDVNAPDYAWLTYAVCVLTDDACGWGGWIIEGVFKRTGEHHATGTGDKLLPAADYEQRCPRCGGTLFRTSASLRMTPSADQTPVHGQPGIDYKVASTLRKKHG
jgi:hypothetical protein